jgi:hypothetical protein
MNDKRARAAADVSRADRFPLGRRKSTDRRRRQLQRAQGHGSSDRNPSDVVAAVMAQPQTVEIAQAAGERVDLDHTVSPILQVLEPFPLARHVGIVETPQGSTQRLRRQLLEGLVGQSPPALQELHLSDGQTELAGKTFNVRWHHCPPCLSSHASRRRPRLTLPLDFTFPQR